MKQIVPFILLFLLGSSFVGCKSTKKAYEKGEYRTAVLNSIERLRKNPTNKKSLETLKLAYPEYLAYVKEQIRNDKLSSDPYRWEDVMDHYASLNRVHKEIQRSPAAKSTIRNAESFYPEYEDAKLKAAEVRYTLGLDALDAGRDGDRQAAKDAFYQFERTLRLQNNYRRAESLIEEARELATVTVQIAPIPMHSRMFELSNEFFENQLAAFIRDNPGGPFVRFVTPDNYGRRGVDPDHILRMRFDDFVVGQAYVRERVVERVKEDVKIGEVEVAEDSVVDVLGTVKASVHIFEKEVSSSGLLDVRIETYDGSLIDQEKFAGTFVYEDVWGFFNGDERALESDDRRCVKKRGPAPDPLPQDLFVEFTKPIFDQVSRYINRYYAAF